jgi:hypothetical protein
MIYQLKKYTGHKDICPSCGQRTFTPYVDENGSILDVNVGRCDRESKCGYHYPPKQFFAEHPDVSIEDWRDAKPRHINLDVPNMAICTIPMDYITRSISVRNSNLQEYFHTALSKADADLLGCSAEEYMIGLTSKGETIYPQIDMNGRCRTAKIIQYDPTTGHRIKTNGMKVDWVHFRLKRSGVIPQDWQLTQCLFGEHLLAKYPDMPVAIVEAEKTAFICSAYIPDYVWLATGGKDQLNDRLNILQGRRITLFPDSDGYDKWKNKAREFTNLNIQVDKCIELHATDAERKCQIDLADVILEILKNNNQI